jgi:hypothetical protein
MRMLSEPGLKQIELITQIWSEPFIKLINVIKLIQARA